MKLAVRIQSRQRNKPENDPTWGQTGRKRRFAASHPTAFEPAQSAGQLDLAPNFDITTLAIQAREATAAQQGAAGRQELHTLPSEHTTTSTEAFETTSQREIEINGCGPGEEFPDRAVYEQVLGASLDGVRLYRGSQAQIVLDALAQAAGGEVRAATSGKKVLVGNTHYDETILLHELVHVIQGNHANRSSAAQNQVVPARSAIESEADQLTRRAAEWLAALRSGAALLPPASMPPAYMPPALPVLQSLAPQAVALQRVETLERPRPSPSVAYPGIDSWVVAPEEGQTRGAGPQAAESPAPRQTTAESQNPGQAQTPDRLQPEQATASSTGAPAAADLPEAAALAPAAPQATTDSAAAQASAQQASASIESATTSEARIAAFAESPPSVKAQYAATLGQDVEQLTQQQAQDMQARLPEFHATLDTPVEDAPVLRVEAPSQRDVSLEPNPPVPAPDAEIAPTPDPQPYLENQGLVSGIADQFEAAAETDRSAEVNQALHSVRTTDPEISTSPGPAPAIPLEGETDPQRIADQTARGFEQAGQAQTEAGQAVLAGPGPEQVQPRQMDEAVPLGEINTPAIHPGAAPQGPQDFLQANLSPEVTTIFDQDQAAPMQASLAEASSQVQTAAAERERGRDEQVRQAQEQSTTLETQANQDQRNAVMQARENIQDERRATLEQQNQAAADVQRDANQRRQQDQTHIDQRVSGDQQQINTRYDQAEQRAQTEITNGEQRAEQERRDAEREAANQSWWDRAVNFVRDAFNALVSAISAIFDAVRAAVNRILDAVKSFAQALIDAAANFIKAAIAAFGDFLKGLVENLLGSIFPGLAAALTQFIDEAVSLATRAIDAVANALKAGINALVEGLRAGINAVLDTFNNALQLAVGLIQAALTGDWSEFFRKALEAILRLIGVDPEAFYAFIGRAQETFQIILDDPGAFLGNVLDALLGGVRRFGDNFLTHLQAGIIGWLTGALGGMGITLPEHFDLMGCLSLVQQILGLTWEALRQKAVRLIGERNVAILEYMFSYIQTLVEGGWSALFERITQDLSNLVDVILGGLRDFLVERVVMAAITRLATLFNPVGAVVQLVLAAWNLYTWIRDQLQRIIQVVQTVVDAIGNIARGIIEPAMLAVENVLAGLLPMVIDLLARFLGLGGVSERVRQIIESVRQRIDSAIDRLIQVVLSAFRGGGQRGAAPETPQAGAEPQPGEHNVHTAARARLLSQLRGDHDHHEIEIIARHVEDELRPQGLHRIILTTPSADGAFDIVTEASPGVKAATMRRRRARGSVRLQVRLVLSGTEAAFPQFPSVPGTMATRQWTRINGQLEEVTPERISLQPAVGIAAAPRGTSGRQRATPSVSGGEIMRPSAERPNEVELHTWNTNDNPDPLSNHSHAERQFVDWLARQDRAFLARVQSIDASINLSPCRLCSESLGRVQRLAPHLSQADLTYRNLYTTLPNATTQGTLSQIGDKWEIHGPPAPASIDQNAEYEVETA